MGTKSVKVELLELEKKFWQALKDRDLETALSLTDEPCIITGAQGVGLVDKKAFAKMMQASTDTIKKFELKDDIQVRQLQDDVAVIAYKVREDLIVDGKPVTFEAADSSTWVRRDGKWLCALHTEAISGDPYGRDRMKQ